MYFNYHAKVKSLIRNGEALYYEFVDEYHKISPCLLIFFKGDKVYPIREHRFMEYFDLIIEYNIKERVAGDYQKGNKKER